MQEYPELQNNISNLSPWFANILNDKNLFALCEGVDTLLYFLSYDFAQINENVLNYFIGILVERVCIVKPNLIEKVKKIIEKCLDFDENYFILSELLKRLDHKNQKIKINLFEFQFCILNYR